MKHHLSKRPPVSRLAIISASAMVAALGLAATAVCTANRAPSAGSTHSAVASTASAASSAGPAQSALSTAAPDQLQLPTIGLSAHIESVGRTPQGAMDVPKDIRDVGWYAPGIRPGLMGDAVIDGHLDWYTGPAVFANLSQLAVGDQAVVVYTDGTVVTFRVTSLTNYPAGQAPADLFSPQGSPRLSLITCSGSWDGIQYNQRLVVSAELARPTMGHGPSA